ncbi:MAG: lytic transglycosylase domain-containing protein [Proteobacteria bacterium]|nr:lytic transglycosylase domain-containing protein [Pseudomonadota bacterium]
MSIHRVGKLVAGLMMAGVVIVVAAAFPAEADPLTAEDARNLKIGLEAIDTGNIKKALAYNKTLKSPLARKILTWGRLSKPDPNASFAEIADFMAANPDWPDQKNLQRRAEEAITDKTPAGDVMTWFKERLPLSGDGKGRYGEALLASDITKEGQAVIRDAWINGDFTKNRELAFYKRHRRLLSVDDHRRRLDRLQWDGKNWPVQRMLWKVPPEYRALGEARQFLRHRRGNVDTAIAKIPDVLKNDPGLIYERLRWRTRKGKYALAREILDKSPDDLVRPLLWWKERALVARQTLREGLVTDAYRIAKKHGLQGNGDGGAAYAEAEWLAGWIALRFLEDAGAAMGHFENMYNAVKYPVSQARGAYWTGRALDTIGNQESAKTWYRLAAQHQTTYYGQLAFARINPGASLELFPQPETGEGERKAFMAHEVVRAVEALGDAKAEDWLRPFILRLDQLADTQGWRLLTSELALANGRPDLAVLVAKRVGRDNKIFNKAAFPDIAPPHLRLKAGAAKVETSLVLAVIRQESAFNVKAKSHASAQGLMQLMPHTALKVAQRLQLPFSRRRLVTDAAYNMTLGQAYLSELLESFKGSYVLALAAYNAGPSRASQWMRMNGDLRNKDVDSIDWVERIPISETRNYVQRVLENLQVYRRLLAKTEVALRLEADLHQ